MKFENSLIVSVKKAKHKRLFVLQEPLICRDKYEREWIVPKGFATDFASIPALGRAFIDKAHQNAYAAVLHDFLYYTQPVPRPEADKLFKEALASPDCNTTPLKQWVMYRAVRIGGLKAWLKAKEQPHQTEADNMADENLIEEEKSLFGKFIDWVKKARTKVDEELDELEDDVRTRAKQLFRKANWPGIKEREILYKNRMQKDPKFWVSYVLIFASSCITAWYWWSSSSEWQNAILFGTVFFLGNMLMPVWARMTFWRGGGTAELFVNAIGLIILLGVASASIAASVGLQGINNDEAQAKRTQQVIEYKTKVAEAEALRNRIAELRRSTTRAPNEIKSELDGLLLSEPSPQSGCRSRDNFGAWSKRNCSRVSELRKEHSQASELKKLEAKVENVQFDNVPAVTKVNPQFDSLSHYIDVDKKTFDIAKPLILAIFLEIFFDCFTIALALITGALVREDLKERVAKQKRALIAQAESEIKSERESDGPEAPALQETEPEPKPLSPAPVAQTLVQTEVAQLPEGFALVPEKKTETVKETTREIVSASLQNTDSTPFLEATEPAQEAVIVKEPALQIPVVEDVVEAEEVTPQHTITQVQDPVVVQEVEALKAKIEEQEQAKAVETENQAELKAEILSLRFEKLSTARAIPAEVQQLAKYALERFAYRVGSNIDLNFALKDYEAWCTKNGLAFDKPVHEFRALLENDLGLAVADTANGAVVLIDTEFRT